MKEDKGLLEHELNTLKEMEACTSFEDLSSNELSGVQPVSTHEVTSDSSDVGEVSRWFHALLTRDPTTGQVLCPFSSPEDAVRVMKTYPDWSDLHEMNHGNGNIDKRTREGAAISKNQRKRKNNKLVADMSRLFHPDKMQGVNCPSAFGHAAIVELNMLR